MQQIKLTVCLYWSILKLYYLKTSKIWLAIFFLIKYRPKVIESMLEG